MKLSIKLFLILTVILLLTYVVRIGATQTPFSLTMLATIVGSSVLISILCSFYFSRRINKLNYVIEEVIRGKLDISVEEGLKAPKDELGDLARSFDRVLTSLKIAVDMVGISKERLVLGEAISERKETEKKLKMTEDLLNHIIENMGIPVIAFDSKGELLLANKKFVEVIGYPKEEVANIDRFIKNAFPNKMASDKFIKATRQFSKGEEVDNFTIPVQCKNSSTIIMVANITAIKDASGKEKGQAIFMRDLSEVFNLEKEIRYWAGNGFKQEHEDKGHHHMVEISGVRGEKHEKSKNRH